MSEEIQEIGLDVYESFQQSPDVPGCRPEASSCDLHRQAAPILVFLEAELSKSSAMLSDLANNLSKQFQILAGTPNRGRILPSLLQASETLQKEDRIQQRLDDIRAALAQLGQALLVERSPEDKNLHQSIAQALRLEEMRSAFSTDPKKISPDQPRSSLQKRPSAGDVDLF